MQSCRICTTAGQSSATSSIASIKKLPFPKPLSSTTPSSGMLRAIECSPGFIFPSESSTVPVTPPSLLPIEDANTRCSVTPLSTLIKSVSEPALLIRSKVLLTLSSMTKRIVNRSTPSPSGSHRSRVESE